MRLAVVVLGLLVVATPPLGGASYVVAPGGNDTDAGDAGHPWATLQHAADTVVAGDTVDVRAGSYAGFELTTSGTAVSRITFAAHAGELVSIVADEPASPARHAGINLEGASYATVQGFHVADRATVGIRAVECDGVHIVDNVLTHNGHWGILTGCCANLLVADNIASGSVIEHGIYVGNSGDAPQILHNVVFDNHANGIHMNGDADTSCDSVPFDGIISNAVVEGNIAYGNGVGGGSGINCDGVQDSLIRNNLIYDTHASGISLYQIDGGGPSTGNRVENNTVQVASNGRWALNITDGATGTTVKNNILWSDHSVRGAISVCDSCLTNFVSDYNVVEGVFDIYHPADDSDTFEDFATWQASSHDAHSINLGNSTSTVAAAAFEDLFVYQRGHDFHLAATSAALDAGTTIADLTSDLEGRGRPVGAAYDVGAFEGPGLFGDGFERALVRWSTKSP